MEAATQTHVDLAVIIPTHNRREMVVQTVERLAAQTYPSSCFEVVVMCDGCHDGTYDALVALQTPFALRVFAQPQSGAAATRNNGVAQTTARVVLFLDDDILAEPQLLAEHMQMHDDDRSRVVIGRLLPDPRIQQVGWSAWEQHTFDQRYAAIENG